MSELDFIRRVLCITDDHDYHDCIFWRAYVDQPPRFFVNCNDLFWWGVADAEEITPENVDELSRAFVDAKEADGGFSAYGPLLFCARMRKERPQGAFYSQFQRDGQPNRNLWALFDACGPERETGFMNPYKPGEYGAAK